MWVAFRTVTLRSELCRTVLHGDEFAVVETETTARETLARWQADPETYCAGIAPIADGTEPHWMESQP